MNETSEATVVAGQIWRHQKTGNLYYVIAVADYTGAFEMGTLGQTEGFPEGEKLVVYVGLYDNPHGNRPCVRTVNEWVEEVTFSQPYPTPTRGSKIVTGSRFVLAKVKTDRR